MSEVTMKELLEAGAHFGHQKSRWNPKMKPYIFTERSGVHIFDLEITLRMFKEALEFLEKSASEGKTVMFVATKKQAQQIVREEAQRVGIPYITDRWMGGTLTNFRTLSERIKRLKDMETKRAAGEFEMLTKKERLRIDEEISKLNKVFEGTKDMQKVPEILFVIDIVKETLAVKEAKKLGLTIVGVCDSNSDPDTVDLCIPANDDAVRAIALIAKEAANAIERGKSHAEKKAVETVAISEKEAVPEKPKPSPRAKKVKESEVEGSETEAEVIAEEAAVKAEAIEEKLDSTEEKS